MAKMSIREYQQARNDYHGYCTHCGEFTVFGDVEPDAQGMECPACGRDTVMGAEEAMIDGTIELTDEMHTEE